MRRGAEVCAGGLKILFSSHVIRYLFQDSVAQDLSRLPLHMIECVSFHEYANVGVLSISYNMEMSILMMEDPD